MALEFKDLIIGYKNSRKSQQIAGPFDLKIPEKKPRCSTPLRRSSTRRARTRS